MNGRLNLCKLVNTNADTITLSGVRGIGAVGCRYTGTLCRLDNNRYRLVAAPLKGVGFTGGLADEVFPRDIGLYLRVAVVILRHPANYSIRVYGNGAAVLHIAENYRITITKYSYISIWTGTC